MKIPQMYLLLISTLSLFLMFGCDGGGSSGSWDEATTATTATTVPAVTFTVPVNNATGVPISNSLTATFSEPMNPSTIDKTTFTLVQGATVVPGDVTYSGVTAVFNPTNDLDTGIIYTATVTTGAKNLAGNGLAVNKVWNFTTGSSADTTIPTVTHNDPHNAATGVATNTTVQAIFSEAMDPSTINTTTFTLVQGATTVTGTVDYSGLTAVFTPTSLLVANTTYTATITTGATDLARVANGLAVKKVWSFTTSSVPDTTKPTVTLTFPADTATGVAPNSTVAATFSEPMTPLTVLTFTLKQGTTPVDGTVIYLARHAGFTPDSELAVNTLYTATITSKATDLAGNELAGNQALLPASSDYIWTFTTAAVQDEIAPTVTITNPDDSASEVPVSKTINATFSELMQPLTLTTASFTLINNTTSDEVSGTVGWEPSSLIAYFNPDVELDFETTYTATVSDQALDMAGNALIVPAVDDLPTPNPWTFTTAAEAVPVPLAIDLGSAASFGIASQSGLTSTGVTVINGDVALYPLATCTDSTGDDGAYQDCLVQPEYATIKGMTVNGSIYWADDPFDSGATAAAVTTDVNNAWDAGFAEEDTPGLGGTLGSQLAGKTLTPGVYHEDTLGFAAGGIATFDAENDANAIFIIKVDSDFTDSGVLGDLTEIRLVNGAQARNIWFIVGGDITIGQGTTWFGNILAGRNVTVNHSSTVTGRVLAGAAAPDGYGAFALIGTASPSVTTITVPH
ncbi:MAG: Ig-like domain-containing protein [Desulfobulbaceae bacterium]|nr:Ig-like domain-containing protein [Desulfobulbaceae bacterium]